MAKKQKKEKISLNNQQKEAVKAMRKGCNVHLFGEGGTGKSVTLRAFIDSLNEYDRDTTMICAPTGVAAINIGGVTLHRAFSVPVQPLGPNEEPPAKISDTLRTANRVIIDEISMCRFDVFEFVTKCIRLAEKEEKKKIQLIVVGDFMQLAPVITDKDRLSLVALWGDDFAMGDGFAFQSPAWNTYNFKNIELTDIMRQAGDAELTDNLNKARKGDKHCIDWFNWNCYNPEKNLPKDAICLCPTNEGARKINEKMVKKFDNTTTFNAYVAGKVSPSDKIVPDEIILAPGMRVMSVINGNGYQNGSIGIVKNIEGNSVCVDFGDELEVITPFKWEITEYEIANTEIAGKKKKLLRKNVIGVYRQIPLKPAYAITIHKSQGKTYDEVSVDPSCGFSGQLYVALSRCKTREGLYLQKKIKVENLKTNALSLRFYGYDNNFVTKSNDDEILTPISIEENAKISAQQRAAEKTADKPKKPKKPAKPAKKPKKTKTPKKKTRENTPTIDDLTLTDNIIPPIPGSTRGGVRAKAGRKAKYNEPTHTMRIPDSLRPAIEQLLKAYYKKEAAE